MKATDAEVLTELKRLMKYGRKTGIFVRKISSSSRAKAGAIAGSLKPEGYLTICVLGKNYYAHRLAWLYVHGSFPITQLDHKNRVKSDNRIKNLRLATKKQNSENLVMRADNTSGFKGVSWRPDTCKWEAKIQHQGKCIHLGSHKEVEIAAAAYARAAKKLFTHSPENR